MNICFRAYTGEEQIFCLSQKFNLQNEIIADGCPSVLGSVQIFAQKLNRIGISNITKTSTEKKRNKWA